ncbi:hypothetical protein IQ268_12680 [Oculatella sp. LEGE 06141]|uniref:hypothetical protein n=1 Tax=Oculatella sp. LEGE 06141 TaxID=1828648 RepID=UPI0018822459|nr:hypothetical protein [Oculatella sp. LEGE 06141]MBE9179418.1 hypothetical protein [Oculatella sp. LEGE 06141]
MDVCVIEASRDCGREAISPLLLDGALAPEEMIGDVMVMAASATVGGEITSSSVISG